jgi:hypothetical protein
MRAAVIGLLRCCHNVSFQAIVSEAAPLAPIIIQEQAEPENAVRDCNWQRANRRAGCRN